MFSFNYVVNIFMCVLYIIVREGTGIKITSKNTIIEEITTYMEVEAYESIKTAMKEHTDHDIAKYNFYDTNELSKKLSEADNINELLKIRNFIYSKIECTYITGAYKIFSLFKELLNQLLPGEGNLIYLGVLINIVEQGNTLWQKVMRTLQFLDMNPRYVLWQALIFTNTAKEVFSKTYPGMNTTIEDDVLLQRIVKVFDQLINSLNTEMLSCNPEEIWFRESDKETIQYPEDIIKIDINNCSNISGDGLILKQCKDYYKYVILFEKLLYRNTLNKLPYTGYKIFHPSNWLLTAPNLEKKIDQGNTKLHFNFTDDDKNMNNVNRISNEDWALNYSKLYFDSVYKVLNPFRKLLVQLMTQNLHICQNYWKTIKFEVVNNDILLTKIVGYCNDIKSKIGTIIEKFIMNDDILQPLYKNWKIAFDAKFEYEVIYDNAFREIYPYEVSAWPGPEFNFGDLYVTLFKGIENQISSYKNYLFDIGNHDIGVLNMFKRSVFKELSKQDKK